MTIQDCIAFLQQHDRFRNGRFRHSFQTVNLCLQIRNLLRLVLYGNA